MKKKIEFETFRELGGYEISNLTQASPSCFNGNVRVRKFRVTVEEIEEPIEVLQQRVRALWVENDNHHHHLPLGRAAKKLGMSREDLDAAKRERE